jgi:hypothetical protein
MGFSLSGLDFGVLKKVKRRQAEACPTWFLGTQFF